MTKRGYVYIIGNNRPTLYIGVTANLARRIVQHKRKYLEGFTKKYSLNKLLYYEAFEDIREAIKREKQLKNWHRDWKINLIRSKNPMYKDLYKEVVGS